MVSFRLRIPFNLEAPALFLALRPYWKPSLEACLVGVFPDTCETSILALARVGLNQRLRNFTFLA